MIRSLFARQRALGRATQAGLAVLAISSISSAAAIVNDTWVHGIRTYPASPQYSERGVDSDSSGFLESAWFNGGTGSTLTSSVGHLVGGVPSGSASWTTFFTPENDKVSIANQGDVLSMKWVFSANNVNASNGNQNMRIGLMNTVTAGGRMTVDAAPLSTIAYAGYAMFLNFGQTTGRSTPFQLFERTNTGNSDPLATSSNWAGLANAPGFGTGAVGYANATTYTFLMTLTHNNLDGLDIAVSMTGGNINGTGAVSIAFTDPTPNTFTYDSVYLRPSSNITTADSFDTTLFQINGPASAGGVVPEPASLGLLALAGGSLVARRRR